MSILHESLNRMLAGAALRGSVMPATSSDAHAYSFDCVCNRVVGEPELHEWCFDVDWSAGERRGSVSCTATGRWVGSVPIISFHRVDLPGVGAVERAEIIIHNGLFAGMWVCAGVRGHVYGVVEPEHESDEHATGYVIERTGEALHEWWTGHSWTEEAEKAQWYDHEPDAARETADEGAHAVYYPGGVIEPG